MHWITRKMICLPHRSTRPVDSGWSGISITCMIIATMLIYRCVRMVVRNSAPTSVSEPSGVPVWGGTCITSISGERIHTWTPYVCACLMVKPVPKNSLPIRLCLCSSIMTMIATPTGVVLIWWDWEMKTWNGRWRRNTTSGWNFPCWTIGWKEVWMCTRSWPITYCLPWIFRWQPVFLLIWKISGKWKIPVSRCPWAVILFGIRNGRWVWWCPASWLIIKMRSPNCRMI